MNDRRRDSSDLLERDGRTERTGRGRTGRERTDGGERTSEESFESGDGSHHPGPPRFVTVGDGIVNPNGNEMEPRDDLAPWNPDAEGEYAWRIADAPSESSAEPTDEPVAEFVPDVPGTYTLDLEAPDGVHELTVRAFPDIGTNDSEPRPRIRLEADVRDDRIELVPDATLSAGISTAVSGDEDVEGDAGEDALEVEYYVDDRDDLAVAPDGTIEIEDVTERARIYAVAVAADSRYSLPDALELVPAGDGAGGDSTDGGGAGGDSVDGNGLRVERPFEPPAWVENAIVYEAFTRRFPDHSEPTFQTFADRLDHLEKLGIDVLWLTPFLETKRGFGTPDELGGPHGYHTTDYLRVDPDLGTLAEFEALVDACHERGIRVVFDLVINHTADTHPFFEAALDEDHPDHERYRDWYRWADVEAREPDAYFDWDEIPNLDHGNPAVREYLLSVVDFWAPKVDGFRTDVAWGVPLSFWAEVYDRVTSADAEFFLLDETLPSSVEMGGGRFHAHHDDRLYSALETIGDAVATDAGGVEEETNAVIDAFADAVLEGDGDSPDASLVLDAVDERARRGGHPSSLWLTYVENHDTDRYLSSYGRDAQLAAGAATFTLPGIPMLYAGQETGLRKRREPMNWGEEDEELLAYYRRLVDLRKSHPALQADATLERIEYETETDAAVAYARDDSERRRRVVIVLHFGEGTATVGIDEPVAGTDLLTGETDLSTGETIVRDGSDGASDCEPADEESAFDREITVETAVVLEVERESETRGR
ncbi:alpha-amylase family glycosyl hydrolase [Natrarchaeobius sp. A-rgal3]|uniref:alpha-amylase family glycosyl hydrolase n=1 Tax=Natrarchaeobius versutus TaxID=1679078 RepID=UPI00350FDD49